MQALEMENEELQSFVGSGRKKQNQPKESLAVLVASRKNFMGRVIGVAFLAFLILVVWMTQGTTTSATTKDTSLSSSSADALAQKQQQQQQPPSQTQKDQDHSTSDEQQSHHDSSETKGDGKDMEGQGDVNPMPKPDKGGKGTSSATDTTRGKLFQDGEYVYAKYATVLPLADHPLPNEATKQELAAKWGHWHFWDGEQDMRPKDDYCAKYPNRDIPGDDFPEDAWQADAVFVNHYLNDADKLITRAMEGIFTEYGKGKPLTSTEIAERLKMFHWSKESLETASGPPQKYARRGDRGNGGWTTRRSFDGLVRRLLHAMMTSDTFTVVMGGHSAAAGQG